MRSLLRAVALGLGFMLAATVAFADYESELYAKAKKEGELVWYTTLIVKQAVRPIVAAFEKKYPGVKVRYSRANSSDTAIKILSEGKANRILGRCVRRDVQRGSAQGRQPGGEVDAEEREHVSGPVQRSGWILVGDASLLPDAGLQHQHGFQGGRAQDLRGPPRSQVEGQDGLEPEVDHLRRGRLHRQRPDHHG